MRSCARNHGWHRAAAAAVLLLALTGTVIAAEPADAVAPEPGLIRAPLGPKEIPEMLPGRWRASLCVSCESGHAWIRLEHCETGEVRTIGRYHLLVGGWFDREHLRWHYPPTFRTGLHMDREQRIEFEEPDAAILLTQIVEDPHLLAGGKTTGHGLVRNNCVTYTRDAWYVLTGEYFDLPPIHTPPALRKAVEATHPEIVQADKAPAKRWIWTAGQRRRR